METEKLNPKSVLEPQTKNGGARPGAGRPKGTKNPATIEKEKAAEMFRERVAKNVNKLFNAQMSIATGTQMLFVVHTDSKGKRRKPEMITDVETISRFLDENEGVDGSMKVANYADGSECDDYFFMTTMTPNNQALEGLLNRAFGRAKESLDVTSDGDKLEPIVIYRPEKIEE